jgi:hypothetical protein
VLRAAFFYDIIVFFKSIYRTHAHNASQNHGAYQISPKDAAAFNSFRQNERIFAVEMRILRCYNYFNRIRGNTKEDEILWQNTEF